MNMHGTLDAIGRRRTRTKGAGNCALHAVAGGAASPAPPAPPQPPHPPTQAAVLVHSFELVPSPERDTFACIERHQSFALAPVWCDPSADARGPDRATKRLSSCPPLAMFASTGPVSNPLSERPLVSSW
jgi:hypothetical protein